MLKKELPVSVLAGGTGLSDRQIRVRATGYFGSGDLANDIVWPPGVRTSKDTIPVIVNHVALIETLVGSAVIEKVSESEVIMLITFLDKGISALADEACAKYKAGAGTDVSIGFTAIKTEPIKGGGTKFLEWLLHELSLVVVGCNVDAVVIAKSVHRSTSGGVVQQRHPTEGPIDYPVKTALDAWLKLEYPDLSFWKAWQADYELSSSLPPAESKVYWRNKRAHRLAFEELQIDRAIEKRLRDMQTPEEAEADRRETIERLAPPSQPFRWDPSADGATNMYNKRIYDLSSKSWRSR